MKEQLIKTYNLTFKTETKWSWIYQNQEYIFIFNKVTREIKIKSNT